MPESVSGKEDYRQRLYSHYVTDFAAHHSSFDLGTFEGQIPTLYKRLSGLLPSDRNARILDAACGNGGVLYFLRKSGYENIVGVDASREQVAIAKQHGLPVEQADALQFLRDKPQAFDLITGFDIIEHFTKDEVLKFLDLTLNALRSDGMVLLQTPNAHSLFGAQLRYADFSHELSFTPLSLAYVLRAAGFIDVRIYPCGPVPSGLLSYMRYILWRAMTFALKGYFLIETGAPSDGYGVFTQVMLATARKPA